MKHPSTELKNPYYFLSTNDPKVIYEISDQQDKDGCGQHFVTYQITYRDVNAGQSYLNEHGDRIQVSARGSFPVSNGKLNIDECKETFPYFEVVYSTTKNGSETESAYFWLDYLIEDDDKYVDGKFVMNTDHKDVDDDFEGGYAAYYKEMAIRELGALLATHSVEEAKRNFPDYLFANVNDPITVNGKTVYLQALNSSDGNMTEEGNPNTITEDDINEAYYEYVCEQVKAYADRLVKKVNENADALSVLPCLGSNGGGSEDDDPDVPPTPPTPTTKYSLTLPNKLVKGHFENTGYTDASAIPAGTEIRIKVVANSGYQFVNMMVNDVRITNNPYTFTINRDTVISNVVIEANSSNGGKELDENFLEESSTNVHFLSQNNDALIKWVNGLSEEMDDNFEEIDPINDVVLSETLLRNNSLTFNSSIDTLTAIYEANNPGETVEDEIREEFADDLADVLITKYNPIYNYLCYTDENKYNITSMGAFVVNDFEITEEETTYWQVKVLQDVVFDGNTEQPGTTSSEIGETVDHQLWDNEGVLPRLSARLQNVNTDSKVNNKYYIISDGILGLGDGNLFELFVKENDTFVSANLFIEIFNPVIANSKIKGRQSSGNGRRPNRPTFDLGTKISSTTVKIPGQTSETYDGYVLDSVIVENYVNGYQCYCTRTLEVWRNLRTGVTRRIIRSIECTG